MESNHRLRTENPVHFRCATPVIVGTGSNPSLRNDPNLGILVLPCRAADLPGPRPSHCQSRDLPNLATDMPSPERSGGEDRTRHSVINSHVNRHWLLPGMGTASALPCRSRPCLAEPSRCPARPNLAGTRHDMRETGGSRTRCKRGLQPRTLPSGPCLKGYYVALPSPNRAKALPRRNLPRRTTTKPRPRLAVEITRGTTRIGTVFHCRCRDQ